MIHYEFGDLLLLRAYPFSNASQIKKRPALVLADIGDQDILVARVTSEDSRNEYDLYLKHWGDYGLLLPSCVRVSKIATLDKNLVIKKIGKIESPDRRNIRSILKKLLGN